MAIDPNAMAAEADARFAEGFSCSQAVLLSAALEVGLSADAAARTAAAFGGGMSRHGWTCGALTGAFIAVGLHAGSPAAGDSPQKDDVYARVQALVERFRAEHGATDCQALIGYRLADPAERKAASEAGVFRRLCPGFVRTAARLAGEALQAPRRD